VRNYADAAIAPSRTSAYTTDDSGIDITTPAYMLTGTSPDDTTGDSLVGLDYYNPPLKMAKDIGAMYRMYSGGDQTTKPFMSCRVLAINHKLTFINYNIHPS
jgi:hypothetical protein